jgi:hypothetical protein
MSKRLTTLGLLALAAVGPTARADLNPDQLRPGLVTTIRDAAGEQVVRTTCPPIGPA